MYSIKQKLLSEGYACKIIRLLKVSLSVDELADFATNMKNPQESVPGAVEAMLTLYEKEVMTAYLS